LAIALHSGNHLGRETADITLMQGNPAQILDFVNLAKQVNRTIRQNLFLSFGYNIISIPLAISGFLTPLVAVGAMVMSSLSVIGNAVLLTKGSRKNNFTF
jgi:cation transport ATPase